MMSPGAIFAIVLVVVVIVIAASITAYAYIVRRETRILLNRKVSSSKSVVALTPRGDVMAFGPLLIARVRAARSRRSRLMISVSKTGASAVEHGKMLREWKNGSGTRVAHVIAGGAIFTVRSVTDGGGITIDATANAATPPLAGLRAASTGAFPEAPCSIFVVAYR